MRVDLEIEVLLTAIPMEKPTHDDFMIGKKES